MRANQFLPLAVLLSMTLVSSAFAQSGIRWTNNLHEARQVAQRDGRLVLIHFFTNWCGPCRKLEHDVFPRTDVAAAMMKNYVPVLIDAERFRDIAAHYQIERFPTDVYTDATGRVVHRTATPDDPIRYIQLLNDVASDHRFAAPGYASRGTGGTPSPLTRDTYRPAQAQARERQDSFSQSVPSTRQRSYGDTYDRSVPPSATYLSGRGYESGSVPNQFARESEYGQSARQSEYGQHGRQSEYAPPSGPIYTPQPPRETYNPHIAPPNGLSQSDPRSQTSLYQQHASPTAGDYSRTYQPLAPDPSAGRQAAPYQYTDQRTQQSHASVDQRFTNPGRPVPDGHQTQRFASTPVPPRSPESPLAMDGYCPVTLEVTKKVWQKGDPQWGAIHRGRTYLFANQRYKQMFMADPDRYSPVLSGCDPVRYIDSGEREIVPGRREYGTWFGRPIAKTYLFADEASLERFEKHPEFYAQKAHEIMMRTGR